MVEMKAHPLDDAGLPPVDALANRCVQWIHGEYRSFVPQWAADLYRDETERVAQVLRNAGITDEVLEGLRENPDTVRLDQ